MHLPVNTLLQGGRYRIIRFIGSGGFGCTYEAEHVLLEKRVAIKEFFLKDFCNRDMTSQNVSVATEGKKALVEKLRRKFIDEARSLSRLHHPGIVSVSDVFEENDTAYFVMEYIDGRSLGQILRESGPLTEKRAVRYILQVADALRYLHSNNRLHLDIKPDNIMINTNDNAVLIDFGASKQYDEVNGENTSTLVGRTLGYAPIEQMADNVVKFTPATDIYALGATLYKLITGNTPISAALVASGEKQLSLPDGISENVHKAVTAAMQINKAHRPQTVDEFIRILSPVSSGNVGGNADTFFDDDPEGESNFQNPIHSAPVEELYRHEPAEITKPMFNTDEGKGNGRIKQLFIIATVIVVIVAIFIIYMCGNNGSTDADAPLNVFPDSTAEIVEDTPEESGLYTNDSAAASNYNQSEVRNSQHTTTVPKKTNSKIESENIQSQSTSGQKSDSSIPEYPQFPGGISALQAYISNNIRYPANAQESGVMGRVVVEIVIAPDGSLVSATVVRPVDPDLDREALRVVRSMPRWNPGKKRMLYTLPVTFRLT